MKKISILFAVLFALSTFVACEKDDVGGTSTEAVAGEWYVTVSAVDDDGNLVYSDDELFGLGRFHLLTYNTADDNGTDIYVDDLSNFWGFKVLAQANTTTLTFATSGAVQSIGEDTCDVTITDGKILKNAGHQNNGSVADSICFYVSFSDDPYPAAYGYAKYKISGIRYSGLTEND